MADKPNTHVVVVSEAQRQTILNELTDKLIDVESYLRSSKIPKEPGPEDSCCDSHLQRFQARRETYVALKRQRKHVANTITLFTHEEA